MPIRYRRFSPQRTVSLTGGDYDRLQVLADKDEVSVSWIVRRATDDYLRRHPRPGVRDFPPQQAQKRERRAV